MVTGNTIKLASQLYNDGLLDDVSDVKWFTTAAFVKALSIYGLTWSPYREFLTEINEAVEDVESCSSDDDGGEFIDC